jgi:hypothetical protein
MRPRLKFLLSAEASGLGFHVAVCKKRRFNQSMTKLCGRTDFFNRIGQKQTVGGVMEKSSYAWFADGND